MSTASRNPFRSPLVSPNVTGSSAAPAPPSFSTTDSSGAALPDATSPLGAGGEDEAPPAYTPAADVYQGEATVQYGPQRPFQRAPPPLALPPHLSPQGTGASGTLGPVQRNNTGVSSYAPPPLHPLSRSSSTRTGAGVGAGNAAPPPSSSSASERPAQPARPLSDFARDFYESAPAARAEPVVLAPPASEPPQTPYAPPPGPPPPSSSSSVHAAPPAAAAGAVAQSSGGGGAGRGRGVAEDGRPTLIPTPGHPLLNNGRVLVYPVGYECKRCYNTGYRNIDPSHPCTKCWSRHAKAYSGVLAYAPWNATSQSPRSNFQRPLPTLRPPHRGPTHAHSQSQPCLTPPPPPPQPPTPHSASRATGMGGGAFGGGGGGFGGGYPGLARRASQPQVGWAPSAPPGALVVQPGDPRIGGRLCWRCDGAGEVSFLIFDTEQCPVCRGMGRIVG